jgi:hypothetical protein
VMLKDVSVQETAKTRCCRYKKMIYKCKIQTPKIVGWELLTIQDPTLPRLVAVTGDPGDGPPPRPARACPDPTEDDDNIGFQRYGSMHWWVDPAEMHVKLSRGKRGDEWENDLKRHHDACAEAFPKKDRPPDVAPGRDPPAYDPRSYVHIGVEFGPLFVHWRGLWRRTKWPGHSTVAYLDELTARDFGDLDADLNVGLDIWRSSRAGPATELQDARACFVHLRELVLREGCTLDGPLATQDPATHRAPCHHFLNAQYVDELDKYTLRHHRHACPADAGDDVRRADELRYIMYLADRDDGRLKELSAINHVARVARPDSADGPVFVTEPLAIKMENICNVSASCDAYPLLWMLRDRIVGRWGAFHRRPKDNVAVLWPHAWHITPPMDKGDDTLQGVPLVRCDRIPESGRTGRQGDESRVAALPLALWGST